MGTFTEMKNATIGRGTKVPHLSYVGDATIGDYSNIGASSVFVNYDGVDKHHTTIGSYVRMNLADTMYVAPVKVGTAPTPVPVPLSAVTCRRGRSPTATPLSALWRIGCSLTAPAVKPPPLQKKAQESSAGEAGAAGEARLRHVTLAAPPTRTAPPAATGE